MGRRETGRQIACPVQAQLVQPVRLTQGMPDERDRAQANAADELRPWQAGQDGRGLCCQGQLQVANAEHIKHAWNSVTAWWQYSAVYCTVCGRPCKAGRGGELACASDWFCRAASGSPMRSATPARTDCTRPVGLNSRDSEPSTCTAWEHGSVGLIGRMGGISGSCARLA